MGFVHAVLRVGKHGDLAPDSGGAFDDAFGGDELGAFLITVSGGDFQEGWADEFFGYRMAVEAIGLLHQAESGIGFDLLSVATDPLRGDEEAAFEVVGFFIGRSFLGIRHTEGVGDFLTGGE